jgi:tRNA threonylcarbamoyladenosine biosynthesis protein TsaE
METKITNSEAETAGVAQKFLESLKTNLVFLKGELGAGKTAFVRGIGEKLGLKRILSPTYTIIRSYDLRTPLRTKYLNITRFHHIDLYRLSSTHDLEVLGLPEMFNDDKNLIVVEWPDMFEKSMHEPRTIVYFEVLGSDKRRLKFDEALFGHN